MSGQFVNGNKAGKGGKRRGAGRKSKEVVQIKKAAAEVAREYIEASVKPVISTYFQLAHGRLVNKWHEGQIVGQEFEADPATTRHFIDKLLPDEQADSQRPLQINFVQFDGYSLPLSPARLPVTILAGNGNGHQTRIESLASPEREGQDGLKFHDFKNVPGE